MNCSSVPCARISSSSSSSFSSFSRCCSFSPATLPQPSPSLSPVLPSPLPSAPAAAPLSKKTIPLPSSSQSPDIPSPAPSSPHFTGVTFLPSEMSPCPLSHRPLSQSSPAGSSSLSTPPNPNLGLVKYIISPYYKPF